MPQCLPLLLCSEMTEISLQTRKGSTLLWLQLQEKKTSEPTLNQRKVCGVFFSGNRLTGDSHEDGARSHQDVNKNYRSSKDKSPVKEVRVFFFLRTISKHDGTAPLFEAISVFRVYTAARVECF